MNRRTLCVISVAVASVFSSGAVFAAPRAAVQSPVQAMFAKVKMVKFSLRNDGGSPLTLKVGEEVVTLEAGKSKALELPVGTRIVRQEGTATDKAGSLVTEVSKELSGVTIALKG